MTFATNFGTMVLFDLAFWLLGYVAGYNHGKDKNKKDKE